MSTTISLITTSKDSTFKIDSLYTGRIQVIGEDANCVSIKSLQDYVNRYCTPIAERLLSFCKPQYPVCKDVHVTIGTKTDFGWEYDFSARFETE